MSEIRVSESPCKPKNIRPLAAADLPALAAVIDATGLFSGEMLADMAASFLAAPFMAASFLSGVSSGELGLEQWAVADEGAPVGLAYWCPERMTEGTWNLLLIAVHPQRQGQGIGSALLEHVERQLSDQRQRILLVETSGLAEFKSTRDFYRNRGYDEEACIRDYYAAGENKVVFRKVLRSNQGSAND